MFESELAEAKAKGKAIKNSKTDEMNLLKRVCQRKNQGKTFRKEEQVAGAP